jgi:hypothetical protein
VCVYIYLSIHRSRPGLLQNIQLFPAANYLAAISSDPSAYVSIGRATEMATPSSMTSTEKEKAIDDWLPITSSRNAKWWYSAFHNVTAMVGAGVLSLPYAMSELGWYVASI